MKISSIIGLILDGIAVLLAGLTAITFPTAGAKLD